MIETPDAAATKTLTTPRGMMRLVLLTYLVQMPALFATEPHEALFAAMKYPSAKDCQTCHCRAKPYGKANGRIGLDEGDIFEPVCGPTGAPELKRVIESGHFSINTNRNGKGRSIHTDAVEMPQITTAGFCGIMKLY